MKKTILFIAALLVLSVIPACTEKNTPTGQPIDNPQPDPKGEPCGKSLYWTYDESTKTIDITGTGMMFDYDTVGPWHSTDQWGDPQIFEIKQINLPDGLTHIGTRAFHEAAVTHIVIPNSVQTIGAKAFASTDLMDITIGEGCSRIGDEAFGSYDIDRILCYAAIPPALGSYPFYYSGNTPSFSVYVPKTSVDAYKAASGWKEYNIIALP